MLRVPRARLLHLALVGVASLALPAGVALAADQTVTIQGFAFNPSTVTVNVGDTVTWTNNDSVPHTATSDDGNSFDTGQINGGQSDSVTFTSAGSFPYHCSVHPTMQGTVVVRSSVGGGGVPGTDTVPPANTPTGSTLPALMMCAATGLLVGLWMLRREMRAG